MTTTNLLHLTADPADGIQRGDDLAGGLECARRVLAPHVNGEFSVLFSQADGFEKIGTVRAGGRSMSLYGTRHAVWAAERLRAATIRDLKIALQEADAILGNDHPLAQFISDLRDGCAPEGYRKKTPAEYAAIAMQGCRL